MQKVLSNNLWKTVRARARKARSRKAAIAYVTQDLLGFRKGDTLVVDASTNSVASGETDAKLLRTLNKRGVSLYDCERLHAKVILLDDLAIISSGNMSNSSANGLVEAGVITDHNSTVAGVASFIEQLLPQSNNRKSKRVTELCKIKVVRRGGWPQGTSAKQKPKIKPLGNRTWLVGVRELVKEPTIEEKKLISIGVKTVRNLTGNPEQDTEWLKWFGKGRLRNECREGDSVIRIWRSNKAKQPASVFRSTPILLKQTTPKWTRFYLQENKGSHAEMSWASFKHLMRNLGYFRRIGPGSAVSLEADFADAIQRKWKDATKS
jgi:hypothetical protein